jgi:hypothetical protein
MSEQQQQKYGKAVRIRGGKLRLKAPPSNTVVVSKEQQKQGDARATEAVEQRAKAKSDRYCK